MWVFLQRGQVELGVLIRLLTLPSFLIVRVLLYSLIVLEISDFSCLLFVLLKGSLNQCLNT